MGIYIWCATTLKKDPSYCDDATLVLVIGC